MNMKLRLPHSVVMTLMLIAFVIGSIPVSGCAGKDQPTIVAEVATHGTTLMNGIKATQSAVIDAEAKGVIPRNVAVSIMERFQKIGATGETVAKMLNTLLVMPAGSPETNTTVEKIQAALDLIDSELFNAIVPIGDETTRTQIGKLAAEISRTITIINREILGSGGAQ